MNDIVMIAKDKLAKLTLTESGEHLKTGDIRKPRVSFRYAQEKMDNVI